MIVKNVHKQQKEGKQEKQRIYNALVKKLNTKKAAAKS